MSHVQNDSNGEQPTNALLTDGAGRGSRSRSLDDVFELLVAKCRREALYALSRHDEAVPVMDLVTEVAKTKSASPKRVAATLHHAHLPKLADAGVVEYDAEARTVELSDLSARFHRYLRHAAADEDKSLGSAEEASTSDDRDAPRSEP
jgi:hypothetical protein